MPLTVSAERMRLIRGHARAAQGPLEVMVGALLPTLLFSLVYWLVDFWPRYFHESLALVVGPVLLATIPLLLTVNAYRILKENRQAQEHDSGGSHGHADKGFHAPNRHRSARFPIVLALCSWIALVAGYMLGDRYYWQYLAQYYTYEDMAMYVNVDPSTDRGQTFMDAGQVYFKESSFVATTQAMSFRNRRTYCVAPILRGSLTSTASLSGFALPPAGTVDFWAVGVDCCGASGDEFTCGDTDSIAARSGMRLLRDDLQPFFLLAVQEWTASIGLPARHPLFFTWVRDPLATKEALYVDGCWMMAQVVTFYFLVNMCLQLALMRLLVTLRVA